MDNGKPSGVAVKPLHERPRGPFPLGARILWWVWCAALVGPIFLGVVRGTFGP